MEINPGKGCLVQKKSDVGKSLLSIFYANEGIVMIAKIQISHAMILLGIMIVIPTGPVVAQSIFEDNFDAYPAGSLETASGGVWPNDGCDEAEVRYETSNSWSAYNSVMQGKEVVEYPPGFGIFYEWFHGVRHRHDLTAAELQNAITAEPNANCVKGTNDHPLVFEFKIDLGAIGWYRHNRFMELTCGTDRAPTPMNEIVCLDKTRRRLNMSGDELIHGSIAAGVIALAADPCEADGQHQIFRLVIYDGLNWHILKNFPDPATEMRICKRWNLITLTVKENTIDIRLRSRWQLTPDPNDPPGDWDCEGNVGDFDKTITVTRYYTGAFTSVIMGGLVDEEYGGQPNPTADPWEPANYPNCINGLSPNVGIPESPGGSYRDWIDDVSLSGGEAVYLETPCDIPPAPGACCVQTGPGVGTCTIIAEQDCTGTWLGAGTTCDQCVYPCADPFADGDGDGDVDQDDFSLLQRCFTGPGGGVPVGCECFDRPDALGNPPDDDIDEDDFGAFENCASGPSIPADITCDD